MEKLEFRKLRADEIEVRVGSFKEGKGASLLLYKNARVDMAILDETVGQLGWKRDHKELKNVIYCGISIKDSTGEWIIKWDAGSESNTEKQKGESSDSFKRAGFCWSIGRELYTGPFIWVQANKLQGKYDKFYVEKITYDGDNIDGLAIKNAKTHERVFLKAPKK